MTNLLYFPELLEEGIDKEAVDDDVDVEEPAADRSNEVEVEPNCNEWLMSMRPPSPRRSTSPSPLLTPLESYQRWSAPKATFTPDPSEQWWQKEIREAAEARADAQTMDEE